MADGLSSSLTPLVSREMSSNSSSSPLHVAYGAINNDPKADDSHDQSSSITANKKVSY
jgi:hypothetical protein